MHQSTSGGGGVATASPSRSPVGKGQQGLDQQIEADVTVFNDLQKAYSKVVASRQQLESQLKENEMVNKEFELLDEEATVYKLIGPVLVKQDQVEAKSNVEKRLEFIRAEIDRAEKKIADMGETLEKKKMQLMALYQQKGAQEEES